MSRRYGNEPLRLVLVPEKRAPADDHYARAGIDLEEPHKRAARARRHPRVPAWDRTDGGRAKAARPRVVV